MRPYFLLAAFIMFTLCLGAQNLGKERTSGTYTYIYRISAPQAQSLLNPGLCASSFTQFVSPLSNACVDSFLTDSTYKKVLPKGHYIFIKADKKDLVAWYYCSTDLSAEVLPDYGKSKLLVYNPDGSLLKKADVRVGGKSLAFDTTAQSYLVRYRGFSKFISIKSPSDTLFYNISNTKYKRNYDDAGERWEKRWRNIVRRLRTIGYRAVYAFKRLGTAKVRGYIVFNKPKYLPGDTVKLKAFITNHSGKPLKSPLNVKLLQGYYYGRNTQDREWSTICKNLSPVTPGAYLYQFIIADTFEMDRQYQIGFSRHGNRILLNDHFKTEDYLLKVDRYTAKTDKEVYTKRDTIKIEVSGTDFNGLPVMDGSVKITGLTNNVNQYNAPQVFVPDTLFKLSGELNNSGRASFAVPLTNFPKANMHGYIRLTLSNSNNETWDTTIYITYVSSSHHLKVEQRADSIIANYLVDGEMAAAVGKVALYGSADTNIIATQNIRYPYISIVEPQIKRYVFTVNNDSLKEELLTRDKSGVNCYAQRTDSTAVFFIVNNNKVPLHYSIYRNAARVAEGAAIDLNKTIRDRSNAVYSIVIGYEWAGESQVENYRCEKMKNALNIEVNSKDEIYPGQKDTFNIRVKDFYNRPVNKANLTAYSLNAQFNNDITDPTLPGWHRYRRIHRKVFKGYLTRPAYTAELPLYKYPEWQRRMRLDSLPYYQMIFPKARFAIYLDTLPYNLPQLGVYIYINGQQVKIYSVHIDNKLVYTEQNQLSTPYSFNASEGTHDIKVRTYNREFQFSKIRTYAGYKLELSCNYDSLIKILPKPNRKTRYLPDEISELREHTIAISKKQNYSQSFYLAQGNRVFSSAGSYSEYKDHIIGPIKLDSAVFCAGNEYYERGASPFSTIFLPESGYSYHFRSGNTILEPYDAYKKKIKLRQKFVYLGESKFGELAIFPPKPEKIAPPEPEKYFINTKSSKKVPGKGRLLLDLVTDTDFAYINLYSADNCLTFYAKSRSVRSYRTYYNQRYYQVNDDYYAEMVPDENSYQEINGIAPGNYTIIAITKTGNYIVLGNTEVRADGINFYRWKPQRFFRQFNFKQLNSYMPEESTEHAMVPVDTLTQQSGIAGKIYDLHGDAVPFAQVYILKEDSVIASLRADLYGRYFYGTEDEEPLTVKSAARFYDSTSVKQVHVKKGMVTVVKLRLDRYPDLSEAGEVTITASKVSRISSESMTSVSVVSGDFLSRQALGVSISKSPGVAMKELQEVVVTSASKGAGRYNYTLTGFGSGNGDKALALYSPAFGYSANAVPEMADTTGTEDLAGRYAGAKSLRKNFKDYGFWQPNILTDKNGNASFDVEYPDNLTSWKTYVLAVSNRRQSGMQETTVRSFKDLTASLSAPQFLIESDSASATGKLFNYTTGVFTGTSYYSVDGTHEQSETVTLKNGYIKQLPLLAPGKISDVSDTLRVKYRFTLNNGYEDGEERIVPVFRKGTVETKGNFWTLPKDTVFTIKPAAGMGRITVHAESDLLKVLLDETKKLKDYPYWCTEQTASKLIGLCMEQKIDSALGVKFKGNKEESDLINKLVKLQTYSGGWSWWQGTPNVYLTNYVLSALRTAQGRYIEYTVNSNANEFLRDYYPTMSTEEKLSTLQTLTLSEDQRDYVHDNLSGIRVDSLTIEQKMRYMKIELQCGIDDGNLWRKILGEKKNTVFGGAFWGNETYNFVTNSMSATLTAYQIAGLKKDEALQQQIITYLLTCRDHNGWRSTFESAQILSTILPDVVKQRGRNFEPPVLQVDGKNIKIYPYTATLENAQAMQINKQGSSALYLTAYQRFFNAHPEAVSDLYEVKATFIKGEQPVEKLKAGELTDLQVTVNAKKYGEYVSIEVPIPAGCAYARKDFPYGNNELHREYFKNKVVIFCEKLPVGISTFHILLEPRYTGSYTINPARAELMYFPVFYGRNGMEKVRIEE